MIAKSTEVRLNGGDISLNRHTGYSSGDSVSLWVTNSLLSQRVSLTIDEAKALLKALDEVLQ